MTKLAAMCPYLMSNKPFSRQIKQLHPEKDHEKIAFLLSFHCFPWDMEKALEFALFRTFAVPSISRLLVATGEFTKRTRKRYDDTELILYEILENGKASERGKAAIGRMNAMHGRFHIPNQDYLYVLSTFIFEPIRWMDNWGWRPFTSKEKEAIFINYRELARLMGIKDVPDTLSEFESFNMSYEKEHFAFHPHNRLLGQKTLDLLLGFYLPHWLFVPGRHVAFCLMDAPLRKAMGFPDPPRALQLLVRTGLKIRAFGLSIMPERKVPRLGTQRKRDTYPKGYQIPDLGTFNSSK
ncbi:oxygenase MpaB family protein [Cyclobacterium plantarum]|nr:oxygenase MpaB family protein [Cyclobacterium plantarum]